MKNIELLNQNVEIRRLLGGKNPSEKATVGSVTEVTKEYVKVAVELSNSSDEIKFLKRNGYFDYRGGRYFITLKSSDK